MSSTLSLALRKSRKDQNDDQSQRYYCHKFQVSRATNEKQLLSEVQSKQYRQLHKTHSIGEDGSITLAFKN